MPSNLARARRFPWTWTLLGLVAVDVACRLHPTTAALTPWIDAAALLMSLGLVAAVPVGPKQISHS